MVDSRSNKRSARMIPGLSRQRFTRPEQAVARELTTGAVLPQESTNDSLFKKAPGIPFEEEIRSFKTDELDNVYILSPQPPALVRGDGFYGETDGDRPHFRYGDPIDSHPSDSDEEDLNAEERDKEFARSCVKIFSNCLSRRISRAMIDLIGIEPNPGPKSSSHDKLMQRMLDEIKGLKGGRSKKSNKKKSQKSSSSMQVRSYSIPAAMGSVVPKSYFKTSPNVQKIAAQDSRGSVRCYGLALYSAGITNYPSADSGVNGGFASSSAIDSGIGYLHPFSVDPRLAQYATTYQWYAFRKICVKYVPFVGTTTDGGLYLGVYRDTAAAVNEFTQPNPSGSGFGGGTRQDISDVDPNFSTSVWLPGECTFTHGGTQLWECFPSGEEPADERIQAALVCITETDTVSVSTAKTYGHVYFEYEIDFYVPGPPSSTEDDAGPPPFRANIPPVTGISPISFGATTFPSGPNTVIASLNASEMPALDTWVDLVIASGLVASSNLVYALLGVGDNLISAPGTSVLPGNGVTGGTSAVVSVFITAAQILQAAASGAQILFAMRNLSSSGGGTYGTGGGKAYTFGY